MVRGRQDWQLSFVQKHAWFMFNERCVGVLKSGLLRSDFLSPAIVVRPCRKFETYILFGIDLDMVHMLPGVVARVMEHWWGSNAAPLLPPFNVIVACGTQAHVSIQTRASLTTHLLQLLLRMRYKLVLSLSQMSFIHSSKHGQELL